LAAGKVGGRDAGEEKGEVSDLLGQGIIGTKELEFGV
jgi:hypothetical protein